MTPCLDCSVPAHGTRCPAHQGDRDRVRDVRRGTAQARGYDAAWQRLSARARRLQPWCSDCGSADDLSADHLPSAWQRHAAGRPIRLADVEVVCGTCNSRRDSSRPGTTRADHQGGDPSPGAPTPPPQAIFETHSGGAW